MSKSRFLRRILNHSDVYQQSSGGSFPVSDFLITESNELSSIISILSNSEHMAFSSRSV